MKVSMKELVLTSTEYAILNSAIAMFEKLADDMDREDPWWSRPYNDEDIWNSCDIMRNAIANARIEGK